MYNEKEESGLFTKIAAFGIVIFAPHAALYYIGKELAEREEEVELRRRISYDLMVRDFVEKHPELRNVFYNEDGTIKRADQN
jgi:hypothetical protein